jgi:hypothetical protein
MFPPRIHFAPEFSTVKRWAASISPIVPLHASEALSGLACDGAMAFGAGKYGDSVTNSCVSEARPQLRRNSVVIIVWIRM